MITFLFFVISHISSSYFQINLPQFINVWTRKISRNQFIDIQEAKKEKERIFFTILFINTHFYPILINLANDVKIHQNKIEQKKIIVGSHSVA